MGSVATLLFLGAAPLAPGAARAQLGAAAIASLSEKSEVVFLGTVQVAHAATVPVDDVGLHVVVRLDEVLFGAQLYRGFHGQNVTVRTLDGAELKPGDRLVFFANAWHYGESLGLVEVGRAPGTEAGALRSAVERSRAASADRELKGRVDAAQLVVTARVSSVKERPRVVSEHDPQWTEAEIEVQEVLKGTAAAAGGKTTVVFPGSDDVMWYRVPKLTPGQQGVFVLRSGVAGPRAAPSVHGLSEPEDLLPVSEAARVKALLQH